MSTDNTVMLIAVLKGSTDVEKDGRIIHFGNNANLDTVRSLAAEKLGIPGAQTGINLLSEKGEIFDSMEKLREQRVVYVDLEDQIKDIIPGPPSLPFVGSLYELLPDMAQGWLRQFDKFGPLVQVNILGKKMVGTNDPNIAELFLKESEYFTKKVSGTGSGLNEIKAFAGQGLFTSDSDDMDWKLAHKLLVPAFSSRAVKAYQEEIGEITQESIKVLEQFSPDEPVEILAWTTNITFETIGHVAFGYCFELLKDRSNPPNAFIEAVGYCVNQSVKRVQQAQFMKLLPIEANRRYNRSIKLMHEVVDRVVQERKNGPDAKDEKKDLLGFMLNARDEHNLGLTDENVRDQVLTFLIAGHDTTANTLAWLFYELARNPDVQAKVLQEIADNNITWDKKPTTDQVNNLKYLFQVIKEILRLYAPVRTLNKYCKEDCIVPGGFKIKAGTTCLVQVYSLHHNEKLFPDNNRFDPDRWTPEEEQKRSRFSWLPFSTGPRACVGMALALQEIKTVVSMLLNKFEFRYDGPPIKYDPDQATTKPHGLFMTIHPRANFPEPNPDAANKPSSTLKKEKVASMPVLATTSEKLDLPKVTFLFGTQTGSAQDYANQLAGQARRFGFKDVTLASMDQWKVVQDGAYQKSDKRELVVICTATYNGQPPDSAEKFDKFLETNMKRDNNENFLSGIDYTVFGLGNKNWRTYQAFPIKVDKCLDELGADRFFSPGVGDADKDIDSDFNEWCAYFWTHTLGQYGIAASTSKPVIPTASLPAEETNANSVNVNFISPSDTDKWALAKENKNGECNATLIVNRELQKEGSGRSTRHIELEISKLESVSPNKQHLYEAGDHIEIMPENSVKDVEHIALGFGFVLDAVFEIDPESTSGLPTRSMAVSIKGPCTVRNALTYYADILSPPSRRILSYFATQLHVVAPETAKKFDSLTMPDENNQDQYPAFVKKHRNLLDLQRAFPQVNRIDLKQFLAAVSVMQPRRYSIASSPFAYPKHAHIAVGVVDDVVNDFHYFGLTSHYLRSLQADKVPTIRAQLKSCKSTFSMPSDITKPLIMIAAGTGFAPFRGFLQERAFQKKNGKKVGPCLLFFGCRHPDQDYIYADELKEYSESGILINCHVAFSRLNPSAKLYVQHNVMKYAGEIWEQLFGQHGAVYICGSGSMSHDVCSAFQVLFKSFGMAKTDDEAEESLQKLIDEKNFLQDVWG